MNKLEISIESDIMSERDFRKSLFIIQEIRESLFGCLWRIYETINVRQPGSCERAV